jgi:hypothetical protein
MLRRVFAVGVIVAAGCTTSDRPSDLPLDGHAALFDNEVQPIVAQRCAFLGCHGREGMPLTFYAVHFLRLRDPEGLIDFSRPVLDELALSEAELEHNRRALAARAGPPDPDGALLARRLVPADEGGIPHAGVVVYENPADPEIATLQRFLRTANAR